MPLERFYRLSEEKQRAIRDAAIKELARVPFDKVSINQIIKEADISRGSFYTYFEDKRDILRCIFEDSQKKMKQLCFDSLEKNGGDIWTLFEELMDKALLFCAPEKRFEFVKNILIHSSSEDLLSGFASMDFPEDENDIIVQQIYERTDKSGFKTQEKEEFIRFFKMAMSAMAMGVRDFYKGESPEAVKQEYTKKLELLRYGVCSGK